MRFSVKTNCVRKSNQYSVCLQVSGDIMHISSECPSDGCDSHDDSKGIYIYNSNVVEPIKINYGPGFPKQKTIYR